MRAVFGALVVLLALITAFCPARCFATQETITITTYYPAPFGVYRDLTVTRTLFMSGVGAAGVWNTCILFSGLAAATAGENAAVRLVSLGNKSVSFVYNGTTVTRSDVTTSELHMEVGGSSMDRVYIGGVGSGNTSDGDPSGGLYVTGVGNGYFSGTIMEHSNGDQRGCIRMTYGANSWNTTCPNGTVRTDVTGDSDGNTAHTAGGYFWCCNY